MGNESSTEKKKPTSPIAEPTDEIIVTDEVPTNLCVNFEVMHNEEYELLAYGTSHPAYSRHTYWDHVWCGDQGRQVPVIHEDDFEEQKQKWPDSDMVRIGSQSYARDKVIVTANYDRPRELVVSFNILKHERDELLAWVRKHPAYDEDQTWSDMDEPDRRVKILTPEEYGRKLMSGRAQLKTRLPSSD